MIKWQDIRPMRGQLLVQLEEEKRRIGLIHVPDAAVQEVYAATILTAGKPLVVLSTGQELAQLFHKGQRIFFRKYQGDELGNQVDGERLAIVHWRDVLFTMDKGDKAEFTQTDVPSAYEDYS